jgi:hypothetical protein
MMLLKQHAVVTPYGNSEPRAPASCPETSAHQAQGGRGLFAKETDGA